MCQTFCNYQDHNGDCVYKGITPCDINQGIDQVREQLRAGDREAAEHTLELVKQDISNMDSKW